MKFYIESDILKCQKLWEIFSPPGTWWDLWPVRECFIKATKYKVYFIVGTENGEVVGVLPLWFNEERKYYTVIGDDFPENNKFLIKDKTKIPLFLEQCPKPTIIFYIDQAETTFNNFSESPNPKYYLDLRAYQNIEQYLATFSPKHRKNLKYDLRQLEANGYQVKINDFNDDLIEVIAELSLKRFQNESSFVERGFKDGMKNLFRLAKAGQILQVISVIKNSQVYGAEFAVLFNNVYTALTGCSDPEVKNLGKLLVYKHIENAMVRGADTLDFMAGADTWKRLWNLSIEKTYIYERKD